VIPKQKKFSSDFENVSYQTAYNDFSIFEPTFDVARAIYWLEIV